jgi:hypothetical protein
MEGFTGPNGAYDCAKYFQGNVGASSQVCIDNNRGTIWEGVNRYNGAWTQCNYNSVAVSCEQSGYASWSQNYWLNERENQLRNIADWLAEEAKVFGIPLVDLSYSAAQGSGRGVCYHSELGSAGCGHSDPGDGFPLWQVLQWAKGEGSSQEDSGGMMSASVAYRTNGTPVYLCVWSDGKINFKVGDGGTWAACDPSQSPVKSGVSAVSRPDGGIIGIFTNGSGDVCAYEQGPDGGDWRWKNLKGDAK